MALSIQQQRVVDSREKNLLVSAAAGSGKTTVLVARVLKLIAEGANIDEFLICTFTRAASADMRKKLYNRLSELAQGGDERSREQLERLDSASISTLDSFCMNVLRRHFEAADVDPNFRTLDESEYAVMRDEALDTALEEAYGAHTLPPELTDLRSPGDVKALTAALHDFLCKLPDPESWFDACRALYDSDGHVWFDVLLQEAHRHLQRARGFAEAALRICRSPGGPMHLECTFLSDLELIGRLEGLDYTELSRTPSAKLFVTATRAKKDDIFDAEKAETAKSIRKDRIKKEVGKALTAVSLDPELSMRDVREDLPALEALYRLACRTDELLCAAEKEACALSFADVERLTLRVLKDDAVSALLREKYRYVFVDEYQDTSDIQEAIISRVCRENNRFMVGDVKQSIYRFRSAEPDLFRRAAETYAAGGDNELIALSESYRSRVCVIDFVNLVFGRVMHGGSTEIVYDDDAALHPGAGKTFEGEDRPVELHLIDVPSDPANEDDEDGSDGAEGHSPSDREDDEENPLEELENAEMQAAVIADRIIEMMAEDKKLCYRDICIITRTRKNVLEPMAQILSSRGVPAYADGSENYYEAIEVMCVMSVLRLLVNRRSDIDVLTVLRSPMFGMTTPELAQMRIHTPVGSFWQAVENSRDVLPAADRFLKCMESWRALSRYTAINLLIRRILADTDFYMFMGSLPGGTHRQGNLDMLCRAALKYENGRNGTLPGFLRWADQMKAAGSGDAAHELSENDDVVRIMTAHASKGLEFKVVFAAVLDRKLGSSHKTAPKPQRLECSKTLGLGLYHLDSTLGTLRNTPTCAAISAFAGVQDRAEELRVFYVTLTRAEERLLLVGKVKDMQKRLLSWHTGHIYPDIYDSWLDIVCSSAIGCPGAEVLEPAAEPGRPVVVTGVHSAPTAEAPRQEDRARRAESALNTLLEAPGEDPDIFDALSWHYPDQKAASAPAKLSVTGIAREFTGGDALPAPLDAPDFISGRDPRLYTRRGTAIHACLQKMDFSAFEGMDRTAARAEAARQINAIAEKGLLSREELDTVSPAPLADFMLSDLACRVRAAQNVRREWSFSLLLPVSEIAPEARSEEEVMVQGCIDLCFIENGAWVLADYKTERYDETLPERYAPQIKLYARALKELTGIPVRESLIYLIREGRSIPI